MSETAKKSSILKANVIGPILGVLGLLLIILFQGGAFATGQITPGISEEAKTNSQETLRVQQTAIPDFYQAIGTVRSRNEVEIMPRIIARILEIKVRTAGM